MMDYFKFSETQTLKQLIIFISIFSLITLFIGSVSAENNTSYTVETPDALTQVQQQARTAMYWLYNIEARIWITSTLSLVLLILIITRANLRALFKLGIYFAVIFFIIWYLSLV